MKRANPNHAETEEHGASRSIRDAQGELRDITPVPAVNWRECSLAIDSDRLCSGQRVNSGLQDSGYRAERHVVRKAQDIRVGSTNSCETNSGNPEKSIALGVRVKGKRRGIAHGKANHKIRATRHVNAARRTMRLPIGDVIAEGLNDTGRDDRILDDRHAARRATGKSIVERREWCRRALVSGDGVAIKRSRNRVAAIVGKKRDGRNRNCADARQQAEQGKHGQSARNRGFHGGAAPCLGFAQASISPARKVTPFA